MASALTQNLKHIAVEGVVGVGKTALAERLAADLGAECIREEIQENPFLERFYQNMRAYAFQTQLFFLFSRHRQQQAMAQRDLFRERVVTDYLFEKDRVFAYLNLDENELVLYERIYQFLEKDIPRPDLVVYLQARNETVWERLHKRGRSFEQNVSLEYLVALADAYNRFFFHYHAAPLLIVNAEQADFVNNPADFTDLRREILTPFSGRRFYSPAER